LSFETVLVVAGQRVVEETSSTLLRFSYRVLTAGNAREALEVLEAKAPVELVLSEALLSEGMSGTSLVNHIRLSYPATTVLLMTPVDHQPIDPAIPLLITPFEPWTLIARVEHVLADLQRSSESLVKTVDTSRVRMEELALAAAAAAESVRQSRRQRTERFCSRLRTSIVRPTVVVAEDDASLRYSVCRYLGLCGFRVLEASDGQEVLNISRACAGQIDVLVTDFSMPGLNGLELARTMAMDCPRTSIIFMTGGDRELPGRTIRKPFELDDLLGEIVAVLVNG